MIFNFLYSFISLCKSYFGEWSESAIKNNFALIYELLNEVMDYGYPQITDPDVLKKYIMQGGLKQDLETTLKLQATLTQVTGTVSWRPENIFYNTNEVYIRRCGKCKFTD